MRGAVNTWTGGLRKLATYISPLDISVILSELDLTKINSTARLAIFS